MQYFRGITGCANLAMHNAFLTVEDLCPELKQGADQIGKLLRTRPLTWWNTLRLMTN
ncbi:hypothetical protein BD311DRAFT_765711 [Dichomitus squalens]|uniref:Uncharacterized protein n=1 Tax=Dichomitus squalens TaxID=114155 RepID=A0A4Q9MFM0_9APHY|nr:hypothetical protein BD311DRAFT_765711 [Dichomitus squalens]